MRDEQRRGFELRNHTADVAVHATGETLEAVFARAADGLAAASCDEIPVDSGSRFSLTVTAESREALLFDYLDELVYLRDVRGELPVDHCVETIDAREAATAEDGGGETEIDGDGWSLEASARGVPLDEIDAREVKAVTYSEMRLERTGDDENGGWEAYVVFDV